MSFPGFDRVRPTRGVLGSLGHCHYSVVRPGGSSVQPVDVLGCHRAEADPVRRSSATAPIAGPRPVPDSFACLWDGQLQQAYLINAEQVVIRPEPSPHFKQCPSGFVPFLFKHRLREPQGVAFDALVLFLSFDDVLIYGRQLLL